MKNTFLRKWAPWALAGLVAGTAPLPAEETLPIVSVDIQKIVQEYQKSKKAVEELKAKQKESEETLKKEWASYQKLIDEANALEKSAEGKKMSEEERAEFQKKGKELIARANQERERLNEIKEEKEQKYLQLYIDIATEVKKDIDEEIKKYAEEKKLGLVLDLSAKTRRTVTLVQYYDRQTEITQEIVSHLNKKAHAPKP